MVRIAGHRGAPALVAENTIESFRKAMEVGADLLECDIHLSRDGRIVVIHDERLGKTTNGTGLVRDFTLADLKALETAGGFKIPTIEEVLALNFPVLIELKSYRSGESYREYDGLVGKLQQALREAGPRQEIAVIVRAGAYDDQLLGAGLRQLVLFPETPDLSLVDSRDAFAIGVREPHLTTELVDDAHRRGLLATALIDDTREAIERAVGCGLDVLLSNNPGFAREAVRGFERDR